MGMEEGVAVIRKEEAEETKVNEKDREKRRRSRVIGGKKEGYLIPALELEVSRRTVGVELREHCHCRLSH